MLSRVSSTSARARTRLSVLALAVAVSVVGAPGCANRQPSSRPVAGVAQPGGAVPAERAGPPRVPVTSTRGLVASAHALASEAGVAMLRAGGNAVDAAVAAAFAIGVTEPNASGLGGEGLMLVHLARTNATVAIDYRSTAPARVELRERSPENGYRSVAVPGTVAGLTLALSRYGTKPLPDVLAPAIRVADDGFIVSPTLANAVTENFAAILEDEALASVFCPGGLPLEAGARLNNPELAATLRRLATGGPDVFYRGEIAERIEAAMTAHGGFLTREDLDGYRAIEREPVRGRYRDHEILSGPPPVGGLAVIQALQILEHFEIGRLPPFSVERVHLTSEALKRGFADYSAFVADPGFVQIPIAGLTAPEYAKARAAEIHADAISPKVDAGKPAEPAHSPSTTSLAVIDGEGNVVVLTQTISEFFGAKVMVPGTGIILNNEMNNFGSRGINAMAPGKRMRTTISPTIILRDGKTVAALGTPGAARIVSTMVLLVSNLLDYRMGIQEAIDAPRFYIRGTEPLAVEDRIPEPTRQALESMGYTLDVHGAFDLFFGGAQGIARDPSTGRLSGGADPRRDGTVVAY